MERGRKEGKDAARLVWAMYDSRPEEKANEPRGRAESERRKRK